MLQAYRILSGSVIGIGNVEVCVDITSMFTMLIIMYGRCQNKVCVA